jgi:hypothetical protein
MKSLVFYTILNAVITCLPMGCECDIFGNYNYIANNTIK